MMNYIFTLGIFLIVGCTNGHSQSKKDFLIKKSHSKSHGKTTGHFQSSIQITYNAEEAIELTASIQPLRSVVLAKAEWKLPKNVKLISGEKVHQIDFSQPEKVTSKILIDKSTLIPGDQIFFFVSKVEDGKTVGVSRSFVYHQDQPIEASGFQQKSSHPKKPIKYYE